MRSGVLTLIVNFHDGIEVKQKLAAVPANEEILNWPWIAPFNMQQSQKAQEYQQAKFPETIAEACDEMAQEISTHN